MAGVSVLPEVVQQLAVLVPAVAVAGKALLRRGNDGKGRSLGQQHGLGVQDHGNLNRALFYTEREREKKKKKKKRYMAIWRVCTKSDKRYHGKLVVGLANLKCEGEREMRAARGSNSFEFSSPRLISL